MAQTCAPESHTSPARSRAATAIRCTPATRANETTAFVAANQINRAGLSRKQFIRVSPTDNAPPPATQLRHRTNVGARVQQPSHRFAGIRTGRRGHTKHCLARVVALIELRAMLQQEFQVVDSTRTRRPVCSTIAIIVGLIHVGADIDQHRHCITGVVFLSGTVQRSLSVVPRRCGFAPAAIKSASTRGCKTAR
jgi:hypothetical protein